MRTVSLSDKSVQSRISESFIPLKIAIEHGTEKFPLDWPALRSWRDAYKILGGAKAEGMTACCVVSPDLSLNLGDTGSAFVWELFDSTAYDPAKFLAMLNRAAERFESLSRIKNDSSMNEFERQIKLGQYRSQITREVRREGQFRLPPRGFTIEGAKELFRLSGDLAK